MHARMELVQDVSCLERRRAARRPSALVALVAWYQCRWALCCCQRCQRCCSRSPAQRSEPLQLLRQRRDASRRAQGKGTHGINQYQQVNQR
jgi:hypothetical protein